jgi:hypothetical protein
MGCAPPAVSPPVGTGPVASPSASSPEAAPPPAPPIVRVTYREAASLFEILDNVSSWWQGKVDPEYREAWRERFGWTREDDERFAEYKQIRKRYYEDRPSEETDPAKLRHGLFAPRKVPDRFANAFYESEHLPEAFAKLSAFVGAEDLASVERLYGAYATPLEVLGEESRPLAAIAAALDDDIADPGAIRLLRRMAAAHGLAELPPMTALFVWWPPVEHVTANQRDRFLIMKVHPGTHCAPAEGDLDVVVHELVHYLSAQRSDEEKGAFSRAFLDECVPPDDVHPSAVLEEPMAVAHQRLFTTLHTGAPPDLQRRWYGGDPWIDPFAKALYEPLRRAYARGDVIDEEFFAAAGATCNAVRSSLEGAGQPAR